MGKFSTKDRTKQVRQYNGDGYRRRADAIIFKDKNYEEVLLVSSRNHPSAWTVPGGGVEPKETALQTSLREAKEEAGVEGVVDGYVGSYDNEKRKTNTEVYIVMSEKLVESWQDNTEMDRRRAWFPCDEAIRHMSRRPSKQLYLREAIEMALSERNATGQAIEDPTTTSVSIPATYPSLVSVLSFMCVVFCVFCIVVFMSWSKGL